MQTPEFLDFASILRIHERQIQRFGCTPDIRDQGLLASALAQPQVTFGRQWLHASISAQAAAYPYHLAMNHPFLDGNKRTAFAAMDTFLRVNGYRLNLTNDEAYELVLRVVQGEMSKEELGNCEVVQRQIISNPHR